METHPTQIMIGPWNRRWRRVLAGLVLLMCLTATGWSAPVRLAIPPAPGVKDKAEDKERVAICLSLYLQESLRGSPGVRLVSESRAGAIINDLRGGARDLEETQLVAAFSAMIPVDALLDYRWTDGKVACTLYTTGGVRRLDIPFSANGAIPPLAEAVAQFLVTELKLDTATAAALTARHVEKKKFFEAYYVSQKLSAAWIGNNGGARLGLLQSYLSQYPDNPLLAARVLQCAQDMMADPRKSLLKEFKNVGLTMAWVSLPTVLGTPLEESAAGILRSVPERFEKDLLAAASALTGNALDRALGESSSENANSLAAGGGLGAVGAGQQPGAGYVSPTLEQRLGALRCLGVARSPKALILMKACGASEDAKVRAATAIALRYYEKEAGLELLNTLAQDKDPGVAFAAGYSLWKRGKESTRLLTLARIMTADPLQRGPALEVLATRGTKEDLPVLAGLSQDPDPGSAVFAVQGLLRLEAAEARQILYFLNDPEESVVLGALPGLGGKLPAEVLARMEVLANEPFAPVARAARLALASQCPTSPRERDGFELRIEHNYIRMKIVDALATNREPWALEALEQACGNRDAHTRAHALTRLVERDPARGRVALALAIADPHRWVRLQAAALLAGVASAVEVPAIRQVVAQEKDEAIGLYLADALAKAEGKPLPTARPAAHSIAGKKNLAWLCGTGADVENSPAEAYYFCSQPVVPDEAGQRAYRAGKIFIPRVNTVGNSCFLISDPGWQDRFWITMQSQLTSNTLPWTDGVVFGEESMSSDSEEMWGNGWPLFCRDAGLDPQRIQGDRKALSLYEARAWKNWSQSKLIEGFNLLYDYTKLYYGKLRPGFMVGTYLPGQGGVTLADRRWKFDFGGLYWYAGSNREMYTYVRRFKTLWPDRPINWLANGCTHLYGNLNAGSGPKPDAAYPTELMVERWERPYADNLSAWMAGADSGWFSIFGAENKRQEPVFGLHLEDMYPGSPRLEKAMSNYAAYVETLARVEAKPGRPTTDDMQSDDGNTAGQLELDVKKPGDDPAKKRAEEFRVRTQQSFLIMGKYVYDCMRVFASLPRLDPNPQALVIHLHDWPGGRRFNAPGLNLLNAYDYLPDINQAANDLNLSRYRMIAVSGLNDAPLMDSTIERVTAWLKDQPVILYVHGTLCAANTNEASTAEHHAGLLQNDWPWEKEVSLVGSNYSLSGPNVKALGSDPVGPNCVLWQKPDFKGVVIFDSGTADINDLRKTVNALSADKQIGLELTGPASQEIWQTNGLWVVNSYDSKAINIVKGVDLLTGEANPQVGPGRNGALVARDFTGKYVAAWNGVAILCDQPIGRVSPVEGGLRVECPGLIRAGSETGAALVHREGGGELPVITGVTNITDWVLQGKGVGQAALPIGTNGSVALYVRCPQPVVITQKK